MDNQFRKFPKRHSINFVLNQQQQPNNRFPSMRINASFGGGSTRRVKTPIVFRRPRKKKRVSLSSKEVKRSINRPIRFRSLSQLRSNTMKNSNHSMMDQSLPKVLNVRNKSNSVSFKSRNYNKFIRKIEEVRGSYTSRKVPNRSLATSLVCVIKKKKNRKNRKEKMGIEKNIKKLRQFLGGVSDSCCRDDLSDGKDHILDFQNQALTVFSPLYIKIPNLSGLSKKLKNKESDPKIGKGKPIGNIINDKEIGGIRLKRNQKIIEFRHHNLVIKRYLEHMNNLINHKYLDVHNGDRTYNTESIEESCILIISKIRKTKNALNLDFKNYCLTYLITSDGKKKNHFDKSNKFLRINVDKLKNFNLKNFMLIKRKDYREYICNMLKICILQENVMQFEQAVDSYLKLYQIINEKEKELSVNESSENSVMREKTFLSYTKLLSLNRLGICFMMLFLMEESNKELKKKYFVDSLYYGKKCYEFSSNIISKMVSLLNLGICELYIADYRRSYVIFKKVFECLSVELLKKGMQIRKKVQLKRIFLISLGNLCVSMTFLGLFEYVKDLSRMLFIEYESEEKTDSGRKGGYRDLRKPGMGNINKSLFLILNGVAKYLNDDHIFGAKEVEKSFVSAKKLTTKIKKITEVSDKMIGVLRKQGECKIMKNKRL